MAYKTKNYIIITSQGELELTKGSYLSLMSKKKKSIKKRLKKNNNALKTKTSKAIFNILK